MALRHVQKTYDELGKSDPLYAVLSMDYGKNNQWDLEKFFARGESEISAALEHITNLGLDVRPGRALDFGCGVGRLTQALGKRFAETVGVDISRSMIDGANKYNRHGDSCRYLVNIRDDLILLDSESFDLIYSNISLQHSPPQASIRYIAEFFRLLRTGGVVMFQVPSGPLYKTGSVGGLMYDLKRGPLRRFWKRIRGKPEVEMHYINQTIVEDVIAQSGGRLVEARQEGSIRRSRVSMMYTAQKT